MGNEIDSDVRKKKCKWILRPDHMGNGGWKKFDSPSPRPRLSGKSLKTNEIVRIYILSLIMISNPLTNLDQYGVNLEIE